MMPAMWVRRECGGKGLSGAVRMSPLPEGRVGYKLPRRAEGTCGGVREPQEADRHRGVRGRKQ